MASAAPALDLATAPAEDATKPSASTILDESPPPVAPDQFDPKWETDKLEIWSYYAYYIGNNGLSLFNFAPTAFQNLLYQAVGDGTTLRFAGRLVSAILSRISRQRRSDVLACAGKRNANHNFDITGTGLSTA